MSLSFASEASESSYDKFPAFDIPRLKDVGQYSNKDIEGHLTIIDFWASWCGPCEETFPFYKSLFEEFSGKGLVILAISLDDKESEAKDFVTQKAPPYLVGIDKKRDLKRALGVTSIPTAFLVSRSGEILLVVKGSDKKGLELIRTKIKEELKK